MGTRRLALALKKLDLQRSAVAQPISQQIFGLLFIPGLAGRRSERNDKKKELFEVSPKNLTVLAAVWRLLLLRANK